MELDRRRSSTRRASGPSRWCVSALRHARHPPPDDLRRGPRRHADELRLKQVLLNLLSNAVKFTPDGGSSSCVRESTATVSRSRSPTRASASRRPTRSASSTRSSRASARPRRQEGTGLGLTLTRRIVELHGGRLWCRAARGVGSTFGLTIPLDGSHPARRVTPAMATPASDGPSRRHRGRPELSRARRAAPARGRPAHRASWHRRGASRPPAAIRPSRRRPRHPPARHGRLGGADRAQGGPAHGHPRSSSSRAARRGAASRWGHRSTSSSRWRESTCWPRCPLRRLGSTPDEPRRTASWSWSTTTRWRSSSCAAPSSPRVDGPHVQRRPRGGLVSCRERPGRPLSTCSCRRSTASRSSTTARGAHSARCPSSSSRPSR